MTPYDAGIVGRSLEVYDRSKQPADRIFKRDFSAPLPVAVRRLEQEEPAHARLVAALRGVALRGCSNAPSKTSVALLL